MCEFSEVDAPAVLFPVAETSWVGALAPTDFTGTLVSLWRTRMLRMLVGRRPCAVVINGIWILRHSEIMPDSQARYSVSTLGFFAGDD